MNEATHILKETAALIEATKNELIYLVVIDGEERLHIEDFGDFATCFGCDRGRAIWSLLYHYCYEDAESVKLVIKVALRTSVKR